MRACSQFFAWGEERGLTLATIRPFDIASYIQARQQTHSAPAVKQQLAAIRMLFDWLITGHVVPTNPAAAVRGPKLRPQGARWTVQLHEKGGKHHAMPYHMRLRRRCLPT